jgi:hypothetical protein
MDLGKIDKVWEVQPQPEPAPIEIPAPEPKEPAEVPAKT